MEFIRIKNRLDLTNWFKLTYTGNRIKVFEYINHPNNPHIKNKKQMKKVLCTLLFAVSANLISQGQPSIQWQKNYGGNNADRAMSTKQTSDGGYIVAGYTLSNNLDVVGARGGEDYWVTKLNASGNIVWKKTYGGSGDDRCYDVQQTADGGYILAGTSNSSDGQVTNAKGGFDMWIVKINSLGNVSWKKNFGGSDDEAAYSIDELSTGGYIISGETKSQNGNVTNNKGGYDFWIVRINATGSLVWQKNYGGSADESAKSVQQCTDGSFIVAGETVSNDYDVSNNKGGEDFWVLRLNGNGSVRWKYTYGGTANDNGYSVIQISNGNFIVVGETESDNGDVPDNNGGNDYLVLNLRGSGTILWSKTFGGETADVARSVRETTDGAVVVAGTSESSLGDVSGHKGGQDFWVVKVIKSTGALDWQKSLGGFDNDFAYGIDVTADGSQVVVGASESDDGDLTNNKGNADFWIAKFTASGQRLSDDNYENRAIKMSVFPNPANTMVNLTSEDLAMEQISILSVSGVEIARTPVNSVNYQLDLSALPRGIYLLKVAFEGGEEQVSKLLVEN